MQVLHIVVADVLNVITLPVISHLEISLAINHVFLALDLTAVNDVLSTFLFRDDGDLSLLSDDHITCYCKVKVSKRENINELVLYLS